MKKLLTTLSILCLLIFSKNLFAQKATTLAFTFDQNFDMRGQTYYFIIPTFISKNGQWKPATLPEPKKTWYAFDKQVADSIVPDMLKRMELFGEYDFAVNKEYCIKSKMQTEDVSMQKTIMLCNNKKAIINNTTPTLSGTDAQQKIVQYLQAQTAKANMQVATANLVTKLHSVHQLAPNTFAVLADCTFDIVKMQFPNKEITSSMQGQISKEGRLTQTLFLIQNNTVKIIMHEADILAVGDFDNDNKQEMFIAQLRESYNTLFMLTNNGNNLLTGMHWGN